MMPAGVKRDLPSSLFLFESVRNWMASCSLLGVRGESFLSSVYIKRRCLVSKVLFQMENMLFAPYCIVLQQTGTQTEAILDKEAALKSRGSGQTLQLLYLCLRNLFQCDLNAATQAVQAT